MFTQSALDYMCSLQIYFGVGTDVTLSLSLSLFLSLQHALTMVLFQEKKITLSIYMYNNGNDVQ